jgi:hypothetical protein
MAQSPTDEWEAEDVELHRVLQVVKILEETRTPAEPVAIAEACGLELEQAKEVMMRARSLDLALYFPEVEQPPGSPIRSWGGWSVTLEGHQWLEDGERDSP